MRPNFSIQCFLLASVAIPTTLASSSPAADPPLVQFDLPTTAVAIPADDPNLVQIELRLSSLIESLQTPAVSQWMVRCIPRDPSILIADYSPRTETGSHVLTPMKIKTTDEESQSTGFAVDGTYANLAHANMGADRGKKTSNVVEFDRVAPQQAVTATGTIHRGKGVFFKLRWTATQVLEGERSFQVTLSVPERWRGGLMDVFVVAQAGSTSTSAPWNLASWDRDPKTIGEANFVVALYRQGDSEAERLAHTISEAEMKLRRLSKQHSLASQSNTLPSMLRHVAARLDLEPNPDPSQSIQRLLLGIADPLFDKQIRKMPIPIRVAALDYVDLRNEFTAMSDQTQPSVVAAKPAL